MFSLRNIVPDRNLTKTFLYIFYEVKIRINEYKTDFTAVFFTAFFKLLLLFALFRRKREKKYSKNLPSHLEEFFYTYRLYSIIDFREETKTYFDFWL